MKRTSIRLLESALGLALLALVTVPLVGAPRHRPQRPWTVKPDKTPVTVPSLETLHVEGLRAILHGAPVLTAFGATLSVRVPLEPQVTAGALLLESHLLRYGGTVEAQDEAFARWMNAEGLLLSVEVGADLLTLSVLASPDRAAVALKALASLARTPALSVGQLEAGKAALSRLMKDRHEKSLKVQLDALALALSPAHRARGALTLDPNALTPDALRAVHQRLFCPENALLGVVAPLEVGDLEPLLKETFGGWTPCGTLSAATPEPATSSAHTSNLTVGRFVTLSSASDRAAAHVVTRLLAQSLQLEGKEAGAYLWHEASGQLLAAYVAEASDEAFLLDEVASIRDGRFSAAEVAAATRAEVADLLLQLKSPPEVMRRAVISSLRTGEPFEEATRLEALRSLSVERVRKSASTLLSSLGTLEKTSSTSQVEKTGGGSQGSRSQHATRGKTRKTSSKRSGSSSR